MNMNLNIRKLKTNLGNFKLDINNLEMNKGLHIVIGGNGSGKSTLFKSLIGYYGNKTQREISFNERNLSIKEDISFLPQELSRPQMTVEDFIELTSNKKSRQFLNEFDLKGKKYESVDHLSGGEFKRASFIQVLLEDKPVMMLDEIEQGLDVKYKQYVFNWLKELSKEKIIILNVHDLSLVLRFADYVHGIKKGVVQYSTTPNQFTKSMLDDIFNTSLDIIEYDDTRHIIF